MLPRGTPRLGVRCHFSAQLHAAGRARAPTCARGQESISSALSMRSGGGQRWHIVARGLSLCRHLLGLAAQGQPCPLAPAASSAVAPLQRAAALRVPAGGARRLCCCRWSTGLGDAGTPPCTPCPPMLCSRHRSDGQEDPVPTPLMLKLLALAFPQAGAEWCQARPSCAIRGAAEGRWKSWVDTLTELSNLPLSQTLRS